jgi:DNA-directed RNA polymerase subunit RPC12/RpoP
MSDYKNKEGMMRKNFLEKRYTSKLKLRKVFLVCSKCGRKVKIRTNDKSQYTPEVRKNYICLFCRFEEDIEKAKNKNKEEIFS